MSETPTESGVGSKEILIVKEDIKDIEEQQALE